MLENRKVLTAVIGYIIGIIMGLYCKISIVLFYVFLYLIYLIFCDKNKSGKYKKRNFKLFSIKRYFRYIKILFCRKVIKIIVISKTASDFS